MDKCIGCQHLIAENNCRIFKDPSFVWETFEECRMATHILKAAHIKQKINPLKASRRAYKNKTKTFK